MKRSISLAELENKLKEMLGPTGGVLEPRWAGRLVDLMRETEISEGRISLVKVIINPSTDKAAMTRLTQLGAVEILGSWINELKRSNKPEDREAIMMILSSLNKLPITKEFLLQSEIGRSVSPLVKSLDNRVLSQAEKLLAKWEAKDVSFDNEAELRKK